MYTLILKGPDGDIVAEWTITREQLPYDRTAAYTLATAINLEIAVYEGG
jgi:hypothetical protein